MRTTKKEIAEILKGYDPKLTAREMADKLQIPRSAVYWILKSRGLKFKRTDKWSKSVRLTKEQVGKILELASPELTPGELAEKIGSTRERVYQWLFRNNLPYKNTRSKTIPTPENFTWEWAIEQDSLFNRA